MDIFNYNYMIKAAIAGFFLAFIIPSIGLVVVNKRMPIIGDALSHVSLAGVMVGLIAGINPLIGSIIMCAIAGFSIEAIKNRFPGYSEISTAIIMSAGIGLASILSDFAKTRTSFESYLFGSIILISDIEFILITIISVLVLIIYMLNFKDFLYVSFDPVSARLSGVKVTRVNMVFTIMIAITIAIASRVVGVLIISSLMVIPVACALQFKQNYFKTSLLSVAFGLFFMEAGLISSFYLGLKPGGTIVLLGVITLFIILTLKGVLKSTT